MSSLLQTVIPAVLGFIVAYQGGLTRTSRLNSTIRSNVDLLDKLPADSPRRAVLAVHNDELVDTLIRRLRGFLPSQMAIPPDPALGAGGPRS